LCRAEGTPFGTGTLATCLIGRVGVHAILPADAVQALTSLCESVDGVVNRRRAPDGTDVPYELASTWYALMTAIDPDAQRALARHVLSQAFVLALRGIPLLYTHVLLASDNDVETCRTTGIGRDLNRADVQLDELDSLMADSDSRTARASAAILAMVRKRATSDAFDPTARQMISHQRSVVIVERTGRSSTARVLLNVSTDDQTIEVDGDSVTVPALDSLWIV